MVWTHGLGVGLAGHVPPVICKGSKLLRVVLEHISTQSLFLLCGCQGRSKTRPVGRSES